MVKANGLGGGVGWGGKRAQKGIAELIDDIERFSSLNQELQSENDALRTELRKIDADALARVLEELEAKRKTDQELPSSTMSIGNSGAVAPRILDPGAVAFEATADSITWPSPSESPPFWERPHRTNAEVIPSGFDEEVVGRDGALHIVHVTAELAPIAKVGGLGDAVAGLARSCMLKGHSVEVVLPFYESIDESGVEDLRFDRTISSPFRDASVQCGIWTGRVLDVPVVLLKPENHFFSGGRIYGGSYNEMEAYLYFCRASLEAIAQTGRRPSVIHVHDWHTSAVAMLYWEHFYQERRLTTARVVMTIHNFENSGECRDEEFSATGVSGAAFLHVDKALDERTIGHNPERLSLMKGGVVYSNRVTTVSPTYAQETINQGAAGFLGPTLAKHEQKYKGVLNGIDCDLWNPATDARLPCNYSADSLSGKRLCKRYLQLGLGLKADPDAPLVACVTRLVPQKGIHLIRHAVHRTEQQGGQFVLLGSAPDAGINGEFLNMANHFAEHPMVRLCVMYSEDLAHLIYAAADVLLVPSMFEPCGLTQMIAMRYGALPCVRRTGGLGDTVHDVDDDRLPEEDRCGFVFDGVDEGSLNGALDRAIAYCAERREWWDGMTARVMRIDNSWRRSASTYVDMYREVL